MRDVVRKRIGIDLDNTLCEGEHWESPGECLTAVPIKNRIARINALYEKHFVIIYTARQNHLISSTLEWLDRNGVKYHAISNRKVPFDILIDNTAYWPWEKRDDLPL